MKSRTAILIAVLAIVVCGTVWAGWLAPIKASGSGTYNYVNDVPCYLSSIYIDAAAAVSNTITVDIISNSGAFTNNLVNEMNTAMDSVVFQPDSKDALFLSIGDIIRVNDTAGQVLRKTINRNDGRSM